MTKGHQCDGCESFVVEDGEIYEMCSQCFRELIRRRNGDWKNND